MRCVLNLPYRLVAWLRRISRSRQSRLGVRQVARSTYVVVFFGGGGGGGSWNVGRFGLPPRKGGFSGGGVGRGVGLVGGTFFSGMTLFAGYFRKVLSCSYVSVAFVFLCTCKQVVFFKF